MKIKKLKADVPNSKVVSGTTKQLTYSEIFTFENLYKAFNDCCRGVNWKTSIKNYKRKAVQNISCLYNKLKNKVYDFRPFKEFIIKERGKERLIKSPFIEERITQKCLCNNILIPTLKSRLIYDNGATIKNKGLSFSLNRLKAHLQKFYRRNNNSNQGYILTLDFHHYFESIDHEILLNKVNDLIIDEDLFNIYKYFIQKYGDKGLGLGSEISQISALFYLNNVDHYIKERLRCKYYARYMDDCYIISNNKQELGKYLDIIKDLVKDLNLELNLKKTKISKINNFVLFNRSWKLKENGFVFCKPLRKTILRLRRHYQQVKLKSPKLIEQFKASLNGYFKQFNNRRIKYYVYDKINVKNIR